MMETTVEQLRELAGGECYAAFKSAALACGMTAEEVDLVWRADGEPMASDDVEEDVRDAGMELCGGKSEWLTSTVSVKVNR